jgi:hypothetical protein
MEMMKWVQNFESENPKGTVYLLDTDVDIRKIGKWNVNE